MYTYDEKELIKLNGEYQSMTNQLSWPLTCADIFIWDTDLTYKPRDYLNERVLKREHLSPELKNLRSDKHIFNGGTVQDGSTVEFYYDCILKPYYDLCESN